MQVALMDMQIVGIRGNAVVGLERNVLMATMALGAFMCKVAELDGNSSSHRSSLERDLIILNDQNELTIQRLETQLSGTFRLDLGLSNTL